MRWLHDYWQAWIDGTSLRTPQLTEYVRSLYLRREVPVRRPRYQMSGLQRLRLVP